MHPKKLEMDEGQDYPEPGWVELGETLKYGEEDRYLTLTETVFTVERWGASVA